MKRDVSGWLDADLANAEGRNVYLLGEIASGGWWYYFPVAFAVKVPVAISALESLAL